MRIEIIAICDAATESQGKLNLLGAFANIWTAQVPVTHPHCSIAMRVRFFEGEEGSHAFSLTFADSDGKDVIPPLTGNLDVAMMGDAGSAVANLILNLNNLLIHQYGEYTIDAVIDGHHLASLPLYIQRPAGSGPAPTPPPPPFSEEL
jgi:hypothetical protein